MTDGKYLSTATIGQGLSGQEQDQYHILHSGFWAQANIRTHVLEEMEQPSAFSLEQNYPNPFNASTTIIFAIPVRSKVNISVFDVLGRDVIHLVEQDYPAGVYRTIWDARMLAAGIYFYQLKTEQFTSVKKALLLR
ncbi:MAG TPA: T9SS type A sorting domain-containing protein [bacterium]|nr:T9SS type A sorting domain-containing protein [bacterium]HQJ65588.1 T9SS type A sorting domain-containing protein [bacterium]